MVQVPLSPFTLGAASGEVADGYDWLALNPFHKEKQHQAWLQWGFGFCYGYAAANRPVLTFRVSGGTISSPQQGAL